MPTMPNDLPTPGLYLRLRRETQGMSIDDVAAIFGTEPPVPLARRAALLRAIEMDMSPVGDDVIRALLHAADLGSFRFDPRILIRLVDLYSGSPVRAELPRLCRKCACSEFDVCLQYGKSGHWHRCSWLTADLCSACGPDDADSGEETPPPANIPVNDVLTPSEAGSAAA